MAVRIITPTDNGAVWVWGVEKKEEEEEEEDGIDGQRAQARGCCQIRGARLSAQPHLRPNKSLRQMR
eukprot:7187312-Prorocentrum_lima.AAC.1